ncbi:centrosomal protein of 162 kDa isoform X2 [Parambassis ranga]|uniref:Centrosomal protein of 162 kDa n=1 Tax=Parambassis ranga TaxID=210632 RepID=A0A6P7JUJ3_9TELE|nr:centrosomal protein of 162 kDa isoform X2 [Parambassis ranga]
MSHRLTKEELDAQFELFLKESVSDESVDLADKQPRVKSRQKPAQKPTVSWWEDDDHSSGGTGREKWGSGKSFRKSLRTSQPIHEEDEIPADASLKEEASVRRDSTETESDSKLTDSPKTPALNMTSVGLDTVEEEEEKGRFYAQLEAGASSTIDYSKLNRELDSTNSTIATNLRKAEEAVEQSDDDQSKAGQSPGSPHYSEDFEDEEKTKEPVEEKTKIPPILAKVSLYDSLEDTGGDDRRKDTAGSLDKGQSYVQSGASEVEALHEAYRQIHVVEESDEHGHSFLAAEERGEIHRPLSPSSPPSSPPQRSLQPPSTTESDLPTAEEMMIRIRPEPKDQSRGFATQPARAVESNQEKTSWATERTFPNMTYDLESRLYQQRAVSPKTQIKGVRSLTGHQTTSQDPPDHDLTWSIKKEVEKLMQEHRNHSSHTSYHTGKAKKQQASTAFHPSSSSERRTTVTPIRGRRVDGRAAVTPRSYGMNKSAATKSSVPRFPQHPHTAKPTKSQEKDESSSAEPELRVSNELVASVQSLVAVLQQQIDTTSHQEPAQEVTGPQGTRQHLPQISGGEGPVMEELRAQLAQKERELQRMKDGAEELSSLRQMNFLLQSKLQSAEEAGQKRRRVEAVDAATEGKLQQIDKEIKEQETLIKGYQQENEKLYLQMKAQQAKSKANEEAMFNENQRLLNELASTREQLNKASRPVTSVCLMDHTQRISDLLAEINALQRNEERLSEEIRRLKQEKQVLDVELQLMKKERDLAKNQAVSTSGDEAFRMRVLEDTHREEVAALKKKLQWFAENQELLDRDAARLKAATAEIHQLQEQVEKLNQDVSKRSNEKLRKTRSTSADTKRMQDLERQVKELEQILRNRNPNSLPALIYAAASAPGHEGVDAVKTSLPSGITALLERRIQRLEAELESHDEEAKRSLRAMEQQFHRIKLRYEHQISELEQQLEAKQQAEGAAVSEPWRSKFKTLQEELQHVQHSHQEKENSLHDQIESLQQQLKHKTQSPGRHQLQAQAALGVRLERLNQELASKTRTIQELNRTVEKLQKERRNMLSVHHPPPVSRAADNKQQQGPTRTLGPTAGEAPAGEDRFPTAQFEKTYQPTVFTGSHISEVLQENEAMRQRVELLQLQAEKEKETLQADATQAKEELCRLQEHFAEQLSSTKAEHLRALDHLRAAHALEHSSSKVAELTNKLNTQEVVMAHLKEQLKELHDSKDALLISRTREDALQKQLTRLLQELKEAKEAQSPEVKLVCSLERKILNMELRHQHREKELQQVIGISWQTPAAGQQSEAEHWRRLATEKSRDLEAFRLELDSILDILRHLQTQGVVLPTLTPGTQTS